MNRKDKINFIKSVIAGNPVKLPVIFCEYKQNMQKPNVFIDKNGNLMSEVQMNDKVNAARERADVVFHEIKTYDSETRIGRRVNIHGDNAVIQLPDNKRNRTF